MAISTPATPQKEMAAQKTSTALRCDKIEMMHALMCQISRRKEENGEKIPGSLAYFPRATAARDTPGPQKGGYFEDSTVMTVFVLA